MAKLKDNLEWVEQFEAGAFASVEELGSEQEISQWLDNIGNTGEHCCDECIDEEGGPDSGADDDLECGDPRGTWEHDGEEHILTTACESCNCLTNQSRSALFNIAYCTGELTELAGPEDASAEGEDDG